MTTKEEQYQLLLSQVRSLVEKEQDCIANMANVASLLHETFHFWWTGFYRVVGDTLVLGPFQGPMACTRIACGRGVCGTAWREGCTQVVPDVEQFPGHIACSSASRSEIVVPLFCQKQVIAVLDIDSDQLATFDEIDHHWLEQVAAVMTHSERELYLAAGCFWGAEHYLKLIDGILFTETGFANGHTSHPTYQEVYTDSTGFAEAVHLRYDANRIRLDEVVGLFFKAIDPTSLNQQGEDCGTRYRTGVYYSDPTDREGIRQVFDAEAQHHTAPMQVELLPIRNFYRAEECHQDYLSKHPNGYCHLPKTLFDLARKTKDTGRSPLSIFPTTDADT